MAGRQAGRQAGREGGIVGGHTWTALTVHREGPYLPIIQGKSVGSSLTDELGDCVISVFCGSKCQVGSAAGSVRHSLPQRHNDPSKQVKSIRLGQQLYVVHLPDH